MYTVHFLCCQLPKLQVTGVLAAPPLPHLTRALSQASGMALKEQSLGFQDQGTKSFRNSFIIIVIIYVIIYKYLLIYMKLNLYK